MPLFLGVFFPEEVQADLGDTRQVVELKEFSPEQLAPSSRTSTGPQASRRPSGAICCQAGTVWELANSSAGRAGEQGAIQVYLTVITLFGWQILGFINPQTQRVLCALNVVL